MTAKQVEWAVDRNTIVLGAMTSSPRLLHHPGEDSLWAVWFTRSPLLLRLREGRAEVVVRLDDGAAFAMKDGVSTTYLYAFDLFFDVARGAPLYVASFYDEHGLVVAAWDGARFARVARKGDVRCLRSDAFAFDARRRVLVHLLGSTETISDGRPAEAPRAKGAALVRILDGGAWRDGPTCEALGGQQLRAGWDAARGAVVILAGSQAAAAWDGSRFHELPAYPTYFQDGETPTFTQAPDGRLAVLHVQVTDRRSVVLGHVLGETAWEPIDVGTLTAHGSGAFHAGTGETLFYGASFGARALPMAFARLEGRTMVPVPPHLPPPGEAFFATDGRLVVHRAYETSAGEGTALAEIGRSPSDVRALVAPDVAILGMVRAGEATLAVGRRGEMYRLEREGLVVAGDPPPRAVSRKAAAIAWAAPRESVVMVGGGADLRETWEWRRGEWAQAKPKGKHPAARNALAAWHGRLAALVLVGGTTADRKPVTSEWDGATWSSYPTKARGIDEDLDPRLLDYDEPSGEMFALTSGHEVCVYRGAGLWELAGILTSGGDLPVFGPFAFDPRARRLSGPSRTAAMQLLQAEVSLAPLLDASSQAAAPAPPKKKAAKRAGPPQRYLWFEDGKKEAFWFAEAKASKVLLRWGPRGAPPKTKTAPFASAAAAREAFDRLVEEKLDEGYVDSPSGEAIAEVAGRPAHVMKLGTQGDDVVGGLPPVPAKEWPACADCETPMAFVMLLHAHEERLPLARHAAVALFTCNGEQAGGSCETWDPDAGCNAALLLDGKALRRAPPRAAPAGAKGAAPVLRRRAIAYRRVFEADPSRERRAERLSVDKAGGYPVWIQQDDTPRCKRCRAPMRFVTQIDEIDRALNFGGGRGYLFVCEKEHGAKFLWQQ